MRVLRFVVSAAAVMLAGSALGQPAPPPASSVGKITGRVVERGNEPVTGVPVVVAEMPRFGSVTDEKGRFVIAGIAPGEWHLRIQSDLYQPASTAVQVRPGETLDVVLVTASRIAREFEEIEVRGTKVIDTRSSETRHGMSGAKIRDMPVENLTAALATRAGVVIQGGEIHVRGGRAGEVRMQIDGAEATDPLRGRSPNVANLAIENSELISGGFDAEYGGALSGVIAVTTREGSERFGGEVRWDTDRYGDPTKTFDNYDRFTFGLGGPTPIRNLTYFATYEGTFQDTYLKSSRTQPNQTLFDFIALGNRQSNQVNTNFKLAYRPSSKHKVTFEVLDNRSINTPYNHMWSRKGYVKVTYDTLRTPGLPDRHRPVYGSWSALQEDSSYVPVNMADHVPTTDDRYRSFTTVWTHILSDKSVLTTRASALRFLTLTSVGRKQPWEYSIQNPFYWSGNLGIGTENNPYFATHGDFPVYSRRDAATWSVKSDFATRHWKQHSFKTGIEAKYNRVENLELTSPNEQTNGVPGRSRSDFVNYNPEAAAYLQDRWEYEGLVLNAGIRYDFFTPGDQISDLDLRSGSRYKQQFSPRLGIAYPISDKDVLSFHYGWTYQTPPRQFIFENRGAGTSVTTRGNPDLEPETNIAYQASMQHLFSRDVSGQFSVFFKDIYGLIRTRQVRDEFGNLVFEFHNGDYASARGFETSIAKQFSHRFSGDVNYTYALATGVASDPNQALQFFNGGRLYLPISEQPLAWDQRHTLTLGATVRMDHWGFRMLWAYGSGIPFTPSFANDRKQDPRLTNSRRLPSTSNLTITGDKFYTIWGQRVQVFMDARNVLDAAILSSPSVSVWPNPYVNASEGDDYLIYYTQTGRAGGAYQQDVNGDGNLDWVPLNDPRVFDPGRSVRLGARVTF